MNRSRPRSSKLAVPLVALALLGAACGNDDNDEAAPQETEQTTKLAGTEATTATGAALGGRQDEFMAAAAALDANSNALTEAIGSVFGAEAGKAFDPLWKKHIGFVVDYTQGLAAKDQAKQDKAVTDLVNYTKDFGAFLNSALPELPADAVADLVKTHILTLKDVIDAQSKNSLADAYTKLRTAADHMKALANPLADALVQQFPDKFKA